MFKYADDTTLLVPEHTDIGIDIEFSQWRGERYDGTSTRTGPLESEKKVTNRIER